MTSSDEKKSAKSKAKTPRPPNPLFDAIAEITASDPVTAGGYIGKVAANLGEAKPPYTPEDVREFGRRIAEFCPWLVNPPRPPTLSEVEKFIGKLRHQPPPPANRRRYDITA